MSIRRKRCWEASHAPYRDFKRLVGCLDAVHAGIAALVLRGRRAAFVAVVPGAALARARCRDSKAAQSNTTTTNVAGIETLSNKAATHRAWTVRAPRHRSPSGTGTGDHQRSTSPARKATVCTSSALTGRRYSSLPLRWLGAWEQWGVVINHKPTGWIGANTFQGEGGTQRTS